MAFSRTRGRTRRRVCDDRYVSERRKREELAVERLERNPELSDDVSHGPFPPRTAMARRGINEPEKKGSGVEHEGGEAAGRVV